MFVFHILQISINLHQSPSISINLYQSLSISINLYQSLSNSTNLYQSLSISINLYQSPLISINLYQSLNPTFPNSCIHAFLHSSPIYFLNKSGRSFLVLSTACSCFQSSTRLSFPLSKISGTFIPLYSAGRV